MGFLTDNKLAATFDLPVALPVTELQQGDFLLLATIKVTTGMIVRWRHVNLNLVSCSVDTALISASNRIYGNLGLAYLALRKDYVNESPGASGALDIFGVSALGTYTRPTTPEIVIVEPGTYSWLVANNMQPSNSSSVPASTSIDFMLAISGAARVEYGTTS